jgi:glycosyltransferase involved in cell wall biosynthesis
VEKRIIAYVITNADAGGAQSHLRTLIDRIRANYHVSVAVGSDGPFIREMQHMGVRVDLLPDLANSMSPVSVFRAIRSFRQWLRVVKPDLIHAHSTKAGFVARIGAQAARIPIVYTVHGWGFKSGVPIVRRSLVYLAERLASKAVNALICVSKHDSQLARRYLSSTRDRLHIIHNGIPDSPHKADPETAPVNYVMVARFKHPKDHVSALAAFKRLRRPTARLTLVGDGPTKPQVEAIVQRDEFLHDKVLFLGERNDVPEILARCNVFFLASKHEGLPISVLEAMRAGLPVVASEVGGIPELIEHGHSGFLYKQGDLEAASEALAALHDNQALRGEMGSRARRQFELRFTADDFIARTERIYQMLVKP